MPEAEIACAETGLASEIRKKILIRFRVLVELNPDIPLRILANRAGSIGDVSGNVVLAWAKKDDPKPLRQGSSDDEILIAVLTYERLCLEKPHAYRYELANEAGFPIGMKGTTVVDWAYRLGLKLPPAPAHQIKAFSPPQKGPTPQRQVGMGPIRRAAGERYLGLIEAYPDALRKQHAYAAADEFGLTRGNVEAAGRKLQNERNGRPRTYRAGKQAAERYLALCEAYPQLQRKRHAHTAAVEFGLTARGVKTAARKLLAERNGAGGTAGTGRIATSDSGLLTAAAG